MIDSKEFIRKNIFPVRIVSLSGTVTDSEALLKKQDLQITTDENKCICLKNKKTGKNAEIILDFGKEINASLRVLTYTSDGVSPVKVSITYGESVSETMHPVGHKNSTNDHAIRDFIYYLPDYSDMTFNESGFRFAKITLLSKNTSVKIKAVTAVAKYRDIPYLGSFRCDNETLNKIYDISAYTCHLTMQNYIWDGIKRDRLVWVGDMHPEMLTVRTVFGNHDIIPSSLRFMREQTPLPSWMNGMPTYSLWWLLILRDWYFYSGNRDFLEENREYAVALCKIISELINDDGTDNLPSYFLDWPCNNKPQSESGSRALLCLALEAALNLCTYYNEKDIATSCLRSKQILLGTVIESYGAKQVTAMSALAGFTDKDKAAEIILHNGCEGWSTFMSYYLLKAASEKNMEATLEALEEYYGGMIKMGATTFWEDFDINWTENASPVDEIPVKGKTDIHADNGAFCYKGLRHSLCHGWASGPAAFLAEEVLGIKILSEGCKKIKITPSLGNLSFAEGTYPTPHGIIKVKCRKNGTATEIEYSAPDCIEIITES